MIDINELRRLAQAATPGPWKTGQYLGSLRQFVIHTDVGDKGRGSDVAFTSIAFGSDETVANARLIAAANPSAISELLDRLEATEEERDGLHHCFNEWIDKTEWVQRGINKGTISPKYLGLHRADVIASLLGAAEKERDALRSKNHQYEERLRKILEEPENTMSNSKALAEVIRQARLALGVKK